jgi:sugar lactone lactonase YvrE
LIVTDNFNNRIRKVSPVGLVSTIVGNTEGFADGIGTNALLNNPLGIVSDNSGNFYVSDSDNNKIRKITPALIVTTIAGGTSGFANGSGTTARFNFPNGIAIDNNGNLYVADQSNNKIRKITID